MLCVFQAGPNLGGCVLRHACFLRVRGWRYVPSPSGAAQSQQSFARFCDQHLGRRTNMVQRSLAEACGACAAACSAEQLLAEAHVESPSPRGVSDSESDLALSARPSSQGSARDDEPKPRETASGPMCLYSASRSPVSTSAPSGTRSCTTTSSGSSSSRRTGRRDSTSSVNLPGFGSPSQTPAPARIS